MDKKTTHILGLTSGWKNSFLIFVIAFIAAAEPCAGQKKPIPMSSLRGYIVRDSNFSRKDFNVWLVTTQVKFDSLFSKVDSTIPSPDFDDDLVLAVKAETMNASYKTTFRQMYVQRRVLKVFFVVEKEKKDREDAGWVSIITVPKDKTVRRVNFYYDDMMIRSIPVVIVY